MSSLFVVAGSGFIIFVPPNKKQKLNEKIKIMIIKFECDTAELSTYLQEAAKTAGSLHMSKYQDK